MNERLLDLAAEAGFYVHWNNNVFGYKDDDPINDLLEKFAELVRADALEEAAKRIYDPKDTMVSMSEGCWREFCASEIKKLKDKP